MHLYLMRHGIAYEPHDWNGSEFDRPLTEEGFERTRAVAKALKKEKEIELDEIWTSPLVRAKQTAEIVAELLGVKLRECKALACGANLKKLGAFIAETAPPDRTMLVGHEPDCGILLGDLTGDGLARPFKKAGVAYLTGTFKPDGMKLKWQFAPKDLLKG